ncbi:acryloyl-CoA reductase [Solimonas sp. K1W22B-7]|uniref:YhdH/YhfP family quinone oxidoreductase n=1 Tax=Solimonas sp. K1W22B-7 TaxID=2303331 RepID=UPI000E32E75F|nr:YhdH/YhfP family quinone oxidoreductase [Solimonas sp. K1W22B-7]AXQ31191.1 acryloyl-CoA reductase [Solimonas sp. K1W22B-7]
MNAFKALRVHQKDKSTEARIEQVTVAELSAGEVVIKVHYSSLNYKDALAVTGKGRIMRRMPCVAGIDLSGVVAESADPAYKAGDEVLVTGCDIGELHDGGLAEYARVAASAVVPLPRGLSLKEAMQLGTAGFTAALALRRMLENHQAPEMGPIAVTGPSGGVGSVALSLFRRAGFRTAAITGKPEAARDYLLALGADEIVDRNTLDLGKRPMESGRWGGAVDNVGGETLTYLTRTVNPWGNIGCIGLAQSHELNTTVMPLILRGVSLLGIHSVQMPRAWRLEVWQQLAGPWKPQHLDRIAPREITLEEVPAACAGIVAGKLTGRSVVRLA